MAARDTTRARDTNRASSWRDLLETPADGVVAPWFGGRHLHLGPRVWVIAGKLPEEHGWYEWAIRSRVATLVRAADPRPELLSSVETGFLVGDRFVSDDAKATATGDKRIELFALTELYPSVALLPALERFTRISVGLSAYAVPFVFRSEEFPLGPEDEVRSAFLDGKTSVAAIKGVPPALDAAFRFELWCRAEIARRRQELAVRETARQLAEQEAERRGLIARRLGDGQGRREMAKLDFATAARAALAVGSAEYLDSRPSHRRGEHVVTYRIPALNRRFECVCDSRLSIIDSGVCLTQHGAGADFAHGTKGDTWLTLESLPSVLCQAHREGKLVIYRHANEPQEIEDDNDD